MSPDIGENADIGGGNNPDDAIMMASNGHVIT
jgi:hypothetical protein